MHVTAIIAAGGRGQRLGGSRPKQLLSVGGRPILERSVSAFLAHPSVHEVVVALPEELVANPPAYLRDAAKALRLVTGGARRQDSVANALRAAGDSDLIVVHDAARPFASADLIARTIAAAAESGAALAAIAARDTVKRTRTFASPSESDARIVEETLPRDTIYLAQTPQAFRRHVLADALRGTDDATDEAALAERAGYQVRIVDGEAANIKITTMDDLPIAEAIAAIVDRPADADVSVSSEREGFSRAGPVRTGRAGTGYDLHRLVPGRPLVVGGVTIPFDRGPLGHSDGDVACHAVTDAMLGAACLGDIGRHFPDSDPRWQGASSLDLLARTAALVRGAGLEVGNVDVTVILEAPKITNHIEAMREAMARAIGVDAALVSVKGKTNEGVDALGRGEAIAAHAVALLRMASRQPSASSDQP
jgi:2-C-methyl-D-erythritol 4-phosphate cytidylyltransferase/2-C-methyl-D-erythritol 2,4-cyclodiphosphate synthase